MLKLNSRERLLTVLRGEIPDCVPVAPDFSNMIPARLTGKPFWDLYLYQDPPIWEAYVACAKHFNIDALMDGYFPFRWPSDPLDPRPWQQFIVQQDAEKIITQNSYLEDGQRIWDNWVTVYPVADPPSWVSPAKVNLPDIPTQFKPVEGVKPADRGAAGLKRVKSLIGDQGLVGVFITKSAIATDVDSIYYYTDNPEKLELVREQRIKDLERRFNDLLAMAPEDRPDFLCVGASGTLIFQSPDFFRQHAFPAVKRAIELAESIGMPTHIHSCGPEKELVKMMAEETALTVIDPLEIPPMGDCNLAELKQRYGDKIVLKGNLHTTDVMLRGSVDVVAAAARQAIDDAAKGGLFILSTGDQCGRDTPDENLHALVEVARTYGKYY
jgi:uroporphyrinogen decarboxylase